MLKKCNISSETEGLLSAAEIYALEPVGKDLVFCDESV
jgi:hypothetical protein